MSREPIHPEKSQRPAEGVENFQCSLQEVSLSFGERDVLQEIELHVAAHQRLAVLGDNGAGKSTLLRLLAGTLVPSSGQRRVHVPGGIAMSSQNPQFAPGTTIQQAIDGYHSTFRELERLLEAIGRRLENSPAAEAEGLLVQLSQVTELYEARQGYTLEHRLNRALEQLGLGELDRDASVATLSGGQRSRLTLAAVLCAEAQLLLLDEPTNDLDEAALVWLEESLHIHRGALVVVSHDRVFLRRFAHDIVQVHRGKLQHYGDGYQGFLSEKKRERERLIAEHESWSQELERARKLVLKNASRVAAVPRKREKAGFGHGAFRQRSRTHGSTSKTRQAKSRINELTAAPAVEPAKELHFALPEAVAQNDGASEALIVVDGASRSNAPAVNTGSFIIRPGERWLVSGPNASGKTALLRLLAGELQEEHGTVARASHLNVRWLRQELGSLPGRSVVEAFALAIDEYVPQAWVKLAHLGLFDPEDFTRHPQSLSVGQQRRLELAVALSSRAELLLLDEPTNHLSPELVESMEEALVDYAGTVITVTHDRRWQQKLFETFQVRRLFVAPGGMVTEVS
ncbi:ABC-F family ATP-binding cassette domain-containing protein [Glutamicibacter arilaitensis]|uniref:ABC-F family ATP-binding cassette domain-containing protein n=1 Tax=Glutamicibacter arilaitensis TaxID=256701 RepID=UPI00384CEA69